jgi:flagellar hook-associated protein 3 FlgL
MSTIANAALAPSSWGMAAQLAANSGQVRARLNTLIEQASTGLVGNTYAGLGAGSSSSILLRPALAHLQTWQSNIDTVATRMQVTQTALQQISQVASDFRAQANNLNGLSGANIDSIAASARAALQQVASLLNTQSSGSFVFAGQDTANPPVPSGDAITMGGFATQIATAVAGLSGSGVAATMNAILTIGGSNAVGTSPFSASLSQPAASLVDARPQVQVGQGQSVPTGILASTNSDVASAGTLTAGSYMRDIMANLAALGALSSTQASDPGLTSFAAQIGQSLAGAVTALNADAGVMGNRQTELQTTKSTLGSMSTALQSQVSGAEDVDMAATLSQMTAVQAQLQASYQLISGLQGLSLAKFLPAGG